MPIKSKAQLRKFLSDPKLAPIAHEWIDQYGLDTGNLPERVGGGKNIVKEAQRWRKSSRLKRKR